MAMTNLTLKDKKVNGTQISKLYISRKRAYLDPMLLLDIIGNHAWGVQ